MRKFSFEKYLKTVSAAAMAGLALVGAGCAGKTETAVEVKPSIAVGEQNPSTPPTPSTIPLSTPPQDTTVVVTSKYKDGIYTATGNYVSPAGPEEILVTVTLQADVIVDATVVPKATNPKSVFMQGQFISDYKTQVIGKKIEDVQLTVVSGSSLTPKGFLEALAEIKVQAKR